MLTSTSVNIVWLLLLSKLKLLDPTCLCSATRLKKIIISTIQKSDIKLQHAWLAQTFQSLKSPCQTHAWDDTSFCAIVMLYILSKNFPCASDCHVMPVNIHGEVEFCNGYCNCCSHHTEILKGKHINKT